MDPKHLQRTELVFIYQCMQLYFLTVPTFVLYHVCSRTCLRMHHTFCTVSVGCVLFFHYNSDGSLSRLTWPAQQLTCQCHALWEICIRATEALCQYTESQNHAGNKCVIQVELIAVCLLQHISRLLEIWSHAGLSKIINATKLHITKCLGPSIKTLINSQLHVYKIYQAGD